MKTKLLTSSKALRLNSYVTSLLSRDIKHIPAPQLKRNEEELRGAQFIDYPRALL